jgi:hypothetical protein
VGVAFDHCDNRNLRDIEGAWQLQSWRMKPFPAFKGESGHSTRLDWSSRRDCFPVVKSRAGSPESKKPHLATTSVSNSRMKQRISRPARFWASMTFASWDLAG